MSHHNTCGGITYRHMYLNIRLFALPVNYIAILGLWQKKFMTEGMFVIKNSILELGKPKQLDIFLSQRHYPNLHSCKAI
jgi:hypothetical protein